MLRGWSPRPLTGPVAEAPRRDVLVRCPLAEMAVDGRCNSVLGGHGTGTNLSQF